MRFSIPVILIFAALGARAAEWDAKAAERDLDAPLAKKDYDKAKVTAERIIGTFRGGADEHKRAVLASAYLTVGKFQFASAANLVERGQKVQAAMNFAEARWAFLHVVAEYFDNEANVAAAHYFSGLCYDRLNPVESDAAAKARREWRLVVERFGKSEFKDLADKELKQH